MTQIYSTFVFFLCLSTTMAELTCKCHSGIGEEACPSYVRGGDNIYTMTTYNCSFEIEQEESPITDLTDLVILVDIGFHCDPSRYPLQYCESTTCRASKFNGAEDYPFSFGLYLDLNLTGILTIESNGNEIDFNNIYIIKIECTTHGKTVLLQKILSVKVSGGLITTTSILKTKSATSDAISTFMTTEKTSQPQPKSPTSVTRPVSTSLSVSISFPTSAFYDTMTTARRNRMSSWLFTHTSSKRPTTLENQDSESDKSFFDDPVKVATLSAVGGVGIAAVIGVGVYGLTNVACPTATVAGRDDSVLDDGDNVEE